MGLPSLFWCHGVLWQSSETHRLIFKSTKHRGLQRKLITLSDKYHRYIQLCSRTPLGILGPRQIPLCCFYVCKDVTELKVSSSVSICWFPSSQPPFSPLHGSLYSQVINGDWGDAVSKPLIQKHLSYHFYPWSFSSRRVSGCLLLPPCPHRHTLSSMGARFKSISSGRNVKLCNIWPFTGILC